MLIVNRAEAEDQLLTQDGLHILEIIGLHLGYFGQAAKLDRDGVDLMAVT